MKTKLIDALELNDFDEVTVWMSRNDGMAEPRPDLAEIPNGVEGLWVRIRGKLADETLIAGIAMVRCPPPVLLLHSFVIDGERKALRFPPEGNDDEGPAALSRHFNRAEGEVFPIYLRAEVKAECTGDNISQEIDITGPVK